MVTLKVQMFKGLEEIRISFDWAKRISPNEWECNPIHLKDLLHEIYGLDYREYHVEEEVVSLLCRRLKGAINQALKETGGWCRADREQLWIKQPIGLTLEKIGLIAYRYVENDSSYELMFKDGETLALPSGKGIVEGLNNISFKGGEWIRPNISYLRITEN